jgi:dTMP kinase
MSLLSEKLTGRFLVVDGPDGAGKTTQASRLAEWLGERGVAVTCVRDPGGTPVGDRVRAILLDSAIEAMSVECELMLYMASRAQLVAQVVRPALAAGRCVLSDRYITATVAYQGAGGVGPQAVRSVADIAVGGLWPDLTVLLDVPAEVGLARLTERPDRMEARDLDFHRRVRDLFLQQARQDPQRLVVVDADDAPEQVQRRIRQVLEAWSPGPAGRNRPPRC